MLTALAAVGACLFVAASVIAVYVDTPNGPIRAADDPARNELLAIAGRGQPPGTNGWPTLAECLLETAPLDDPSFSAAWRSPERRARLRAILVQPPFIRPWDADGILWDQTLPVTTTGARLLRTLADHADEELRGEVAAPNAESARESLLLGLNLATVLQQQSSSVEAVAGVRGLRRTLAGIRSLVGPAERPLSNVGLTELAARLQRLDEAQAFAIERDVEIARLAAQSVVRSLHGTRGYALPLTSVFGDPTIAGDLAAYDAVDPVAGDRSLLLAWRCRWTMATLDECLAMSDQIHDAHQAEARQPLATRWAEWPPRSLVDMVESEPNRVVHRAAPFLQQILKARSALRSELRATRIMIALAQAVRTDGRYPESLTAVVPALLTESPIDPMCGPDDGGPFLYERLPGSDYRLLSVGPDGLSGPNQVDQESPTARDDDASWWAGSDRRFR
ncbi:MAG: hypothetical protein JNL80_02410 [Phycisphaerae bacterium]|nr:hypothetical protein [Phycisphaerae bacterium]